MHHVNQQRGILRILFTATTFDRVSLRLPNENLSGLTLDLMTV